MKVTVLYLHVCGLSTGFEMRPSTIEEFNGCSRRFAETYKACDPGYPHELVVCCTNGPKSNTEMFDGIECRWESYRGGGWDIGAEQTMARQCDSDFIVCMTSRSHFRRAGWLKRFMSEVEKHGEGLYGSTGSYENCHLHCPTTRGYRPNPHIRTAFYGMTPDLFRKYPFPVQSREDGFMFESSPKSITNYCLSRGIPALMVTWNGCYEWKDWRTPKNVFRKGNQSALIAFDRHSDMYEQASMEMKIAMAKSADGWYQ